MTETYKYPIKLEMTIELDGPHKFSEAARIFWKYVEVLTHEPSLLSVDSSGVFTCSVPLDQLPRYRCTRIPKKKAARPEGDT
jgi:hypothetical protein